MHDRSAVPRRTVSRAGHVLVYGTLRAGEPAHARLALREALSFRGHRRVPGRLYDLGPYPGLVLEPGSIRAELYAINEPSVLATLDCYEGYDPRSPAESLFVRTIVRVARRAHSEAASLPAFVYVYNGSVAGCAEIGERSWPEHRRRRGTSPRVFNGSRRRHG